MSSCSPYQFSGYFAALFPEKCCKMQNKVPLQGVTVIDVYCVVKVITVSSNILFLVRRLSKQDISTELEHVSKRPDFACVSICVDFIISFQKLVNSDVTNFPTQAILSASMLKARL